MQAFLHHPTAPGLNAPGRRMAQICTRRTAPHRASAHVVVSALTDEAPPVGGAPASTPPFRRQEPNNPPLRPNQPNSRPSSYDSRPSFDTPSRQRQDFPLRSDRPRPQRSGERRTGTSAPRQERGPERYPPRAPFIADPKATYYTKCGACAAAYELEPQVLGDRGKKVGCAVCGNEWFQKPDRLFVLKGTEGFKEYPLAEKDSIIQARNEARRERGSRGRGTDRNTGYPQRNGGRDSYPRREGGQRDGARRAPRPRSQHSVFIGNLPFSCTEEKLEELLKTRVNVNRISIVKDMETGRSRGFAFADLDSDADVSLVVNAMDGTELDGRSLTVRVGKKN